MFLAQIEAQSRQGRGPGILGLLDTDAFQLSELLASQLVVETDIWIWVDEYKRGVMNLRL